MPESRQPSPVAPSATWTQRYEALRAQAMASADRIAGWGLALACRQGLVAWMRAWPQDSSTTLTSASMDVEAGTLPANLRGQLTLVLTDMILTHQQEVWV